MLAPCRSVITTNKNVLQTEKFFRDRFQRIFVPYQQRELRPIRERPADIGNFLVHLLQQNSPQRQNEKSARERQAAQQQSGVQGHHPRQQAFL